MSLLRVATIIRREGTRTFISLPKKDLLDFLAEYERFTDTKYTSIQLTGCFSESDLSERSVVCIDFHIEEHAFPRFMEFRRHFSTGEDLRIGEIQNPTPMYTEPLGKFSLDDC